MLSSLAQLGGKLYGWLIGALVAVAAVVGIYLRGRSAGKQVEQSKQAQRDLAAERSRSEVIREASDAQIEISRLPDDAVRERLHRWTRD